MSRVIVKRENHKMITMITLIIMKSRNPGPSARKNQQKRIITALYKSTEIVVVCYFMIILSPSDMGPGGGITRVCRHQTEMREGEARLRRGGQDCCVTRHEPPSV